MTGLRLPCWMILLIIGSPYMSGISQALVPDAASTPAVKHAISFYSASLKQQLHLFNGKEYKEYALPFDEGHPYFATTDWRLGTVNYDGNTYSDVSILYDLVKDEVIILNTNKVSKIQLIKEKVDGFSFNGHSFLHLRRDSLFSANIAPGFYDVLVAGKISLLCRRTKNIQTYTKQKLELKVFHRDHFYLKKDNAYVQVRNKKSLIEQLGDKKKELQQYMKQNKLNFRKDPENTMIKITDYYNQLTK